jgi:hypothetical protein
MIITEKDEIIDTDVSDLEHKELMNLLHNGEISLGRSDILECNFYFSRFIENRKLETHNGRILNIIASGLAEKGRGYDYISGNSIYFNIGKDGVELPLTEEQKYKLKYIHKRHIRECQIDGYEIFAVEELKGERKPYFIEKEKILMLIQNNKISTINTETKKMEKLEIEVIFDILDVIDQETDSMEYRLEIPIVYKKTSRKIYRMNLLLRKK